MKKSVIIALLVMIGCGTVMGGGDDYYIIALKGKGSGDGTQQLREIILTKIIKEKYANVWLFAAGSSHLFWLKMGCVPFQDKANILPVFVYNPGSKRLKVDCPIVQAAMELESIMRGTRDGAMNKGEIDNLRKLIRIYRVYLDISAENLKGIEKKDDFYKDEEIQKKVSAFLAGVPEIDIFAVKLTKAINENVQRRGSYLKSSKDIDTSDVTIGENWFPMRMSSEGLERWQTAITENQDFKPFRDLSPFIKGIKSSVIRKELEDAMDKCPIGVFFKTDE
jgi:hypothetical protein